MTDSLGISREGIDLALKIKEGYKSQEPLCVPGEQGRILVPEHLVNRDLHLESLEDPLPLALLAVRDPEAPMALAAAARLTPKVQDRKLIKGVFDMVGEATKHREVQKCIELVSENDFSPQVIDAVHKRTSAYITLARKQYTLALRQTLRALLDGDLEPRAFVERFFQLTEAGNLRHDVRKKLVASLLTSKTIRPGIKFLFLEHFHRIPRAVRISIIGEVVKAPRGPHVDMIKEELRWILSQEREAREARAAGVH